MTDSGPGEAKWRWFEPASAILMALATLGRNHAPTLGAFAGLAKRSRSIIMRCIDFEQLRLLSVNTLDKPKKKRHNYMLDVASEAASI